MTNGNGTHHVTINGRHQGDMFPDLPQSDVLPLGSGDLDTEARLLDLRLKKAKCLQLETLTALRTGQTVMASEFMAFARLVLRAVKRSLKEHEGEVLDSGNLGAITKAISAASKKALPQSLR